MLNFAYSPPTLSPLYRTGPKQGELEWEKLEKRQEASVAEPVIIERASTVVFVFRKDGSLQFCVDYRPFIAVTKQDRRPVLEWISAMFY